MKIGDDADFPHVESPPSYEEAILETTSVPHAPAVKIALDPSDDKRTASYKKGKQWAEMAALIAPCVRYGLPIGCGVIFIAFVAGTGGLAALPLVFLMPLINAAGKKASDMIIRTGALMLESRPETSKAYGETLKNKDYNPDLRLPCEEAIVGGCRRIYGAVKNGVEGIRSFFSRVST